MPADAIYVGRPSVWGNPFPIDGDWIVWAAVALGFTGDVKGRRAAAVALYRSWLTKSPVPDAEPAPGGEIEFDNGQQISAHGMVMGFGARMALALPMPKLPEQRPDLTPLKGRSLLCWCPLGEPCHADVLLEIANQRS